MTAKDFFIKCILTIPALFVGFVSLLYVIYRPVKELWSEYDFSLPQIKDLKNISTKS